MLGVYNKEFFLGLEQLGLDDELGENLLFVEDIQNYISRPEIWFSLEKASLFNATAVYFRKAVGNKYIAQVYVYDFSLADAAIDALTLIHKQVWTSGEVPIVCAFYKTEIKILDCTAPIDTQLDQPTYLAESIKLSIEVHKIFNRQFARDVKSGVFWNEEAFDKRFEFRKSAHDKLIIYLRGVINDFVLKSNVSDYTAQKLIIQSILVKYLEERVDQQGNGIFPDGYFKRYNNSDTFCDVLRNGAYFQLFDDLNRNHFNGRIFEWTTEELSELKDCKLDELANALDGRHVYGGQLSFDFWRQYEFNYIPVELISRLYEEFLGFGKKGLVYTPPHLAKLLIDEAMPLAKSQNTDTFTLIDPACGSGIFLVIAYKRLVQWWRINNELVTPPLEILKQILKNCIYGVDIEEKATQLSAFSLCIALCDELTPKQIWDELKFDRLTDKNIFSSDFFVWKKNNLKKFNLVVGNPPFIRGGVTRAIGLSSKLRDLSIKIPFKQISIKFLIESLDILDVDGLLCMIGNSSSLLYNPSSSDFKRALFSNYNVVQVFDFTHLARNKTLWDNKEPSTVALFIENKVPEPRKNILHITFRRNKATKSRLLFEIDEYDLHFINRRTAIENHYIWKNNLLGGGRIKQTVQKLEEWNTFENYLTENKLSLGFKWGEGVTDGIGPPDNFFNTRNNSLFPEDEVQVPKEYYAKFALSKRKDFFKAPVLIIGENIGIDDNRIPMKFMKNDFPFFNEIIGIHANEKQYLEVIHDCFLKNMDVFRFNIFCKSGKLLIYKNTSCTMHDIMQLPFTTTETIISELSAIDKHIISDVNNYMQAYLRHGESSEALKPVKQNDFNFITIFGNEFCRALNIVYSSEKAKFRLSGIIKFNDNKFIAVAFSYDKRENGNIGIETIRDYNTEEMQAMTNPEITSSLSTTRMIRIYKKDELIIIKPNQKKYWLPLFAYRDADRTFADISKLEN